MYFSSQIPKSGQYSTLVPHLPQHLSDQQYIWNKFQSVITNSFLN